MKSRYIVPVLLLCLTLAFLAGCSKSGDDDGDDDDDDDSGGPGADGIEGRLKCDDWSDCPGELVCRDGFCAEARFPVVNESAYRRVTADDPDENVIVNGRLIRPAARTLELGTFPTNVERSPDGTILAVNENGFGTVIDPEHWRDKKHVLRLVDTSDMSIEQEIVMPNGSMYIGLRFNGTGDKLYVSGGEDRQVHVFDVAGKSAALDRSIDVPGCYTSDLVLSGDESVLYVSCDLDGKVAAVDLSGDTVAGDFSAGSRPYNMVLGADGQKLFVSNWARETIYKNGEIPPEEFEKAGYPRQPDTVTVLNPANGERIASIQVGLGPEKLVLSPDGTKVYCVCNKSDSIHEIDVAGLAVLRTFSLHDDPMALKGIYPVSAVLSPDGTRLYVTGAGENLVAVIDLASGSVKGLIPTEWYPTDIDISADGQTLYVLNGKGKGDGPTEHTGQGAGTSDCDVVGRQIFGSVFKLPVPDQEALDDYTQIVRENNLRQQTYFDLSGGNDTALPSAENAGRSPIKYTFMILKENFSYDAAYGDMEIGEGEPDYNLWTEEMIPNQRKLAREFVLLDNFYCDSESSIDGHQWAAAAIEPDFVEKGWVMEYAGYGMPQIVVSLNPGSVPESQFWMPHLIEQGFSVRGFGGIENFGLEAVTKYRDNLNLAYPFLLEKEFWDRDRGWMFVQEFEQRVAEGTVPSFSWIFMPNNHAFGVHPGEYTPPHWVADNDEGVGIVVEAISNSPVWGESLILIFEDDAQHGFDHIDKHRSPALAVSPWVKRGYVSSVAYSMPNMHKTMELILGSQPMHRFDDLCTGMYDMFTARPDLTPYQRVERIYPEEIYEGDKDDDLVKLSATMDWSEIDLNQWSAAELYWRYMKGTAPPESGSAEPEEEEGEEEEEKILFSF